MRTLMGPYVAVLQLTAEVIGLVVSLAGRIVRGLESVGRGIATAWAAIHTALTGVQALIDGAVSGVADGIARLLTYILNTVLGPVREHLDNLSQLWDEWIGRHLPDVLGEGFAPAAHGLHVE